MVDKLYLSSTEAAEFLGVSLNTIINWDKNGKLVPTRRTKKGNREYSKSDLLDYQRKKQEKCTALNYKIGYFWLSSPFSYSYQTYLIQSAIKYHGITDIICDEGNNKNGLEDLTGLNKVLNKIDNKEITELVLIGITNLSPLLMRLLESYCKNANVILTKYKVDLMNWGKSICKQYNCKGNSIEDNKAINEFMDERQYMDELTACCRQFEDEIEIYEQDKAFYDYVETLERSDFDYKLMVVQDYYNTFYKLPNIEEKLAIRDADVSKLFNFITFCKESNLDFVKEVEHNEDIKKALNDIYVYNGRVVLKDTLVKD